MSEKTKISWTDASWNPWVGCRKVSAGCEHCYAEKMAARFYPSLPWDGTRYKLFDDKHWALPLKWNRAAEKSGKRMKVFCGSMCDVFDGNMLLDEERVRLWKLIEATPALDWPLLTKRPENIARMLPTIQIGGEDIARFDNIWLGVTVENQEAADKRIQSLLEAPASIRFLSIEPMLGPVDLLRVAWPGKWSDGHVHRVDVLRGGYWDDDPASFFKGFVNHSDMPGFPKPIKWIIVGSESGHSVRPMQLDWVRSLRDQCQAAETPFFFKQAMVNGRIDHEPMLDGRTWREFPKVQA